MITVSQQIVNSQTAKTMKSKINIEGIIRNCQPPKDINLKAGGTTRVMEAELEDSAGRITIKLWGDEIQKVKEGSKVAFKNAWMSTFNDQSSLQKGKFGEFVVLSY